MKTKTILTAWLISMATNFNAQNFEWAKSIGHGTTSGFSICTDAFGNVYTTGYFYGTTDFDPGAGVFNLTSLGEEDIFVQKQMPTVIYYG